MIETITLRNYKGHTDTTVACERLTVLVGENASGKTSVLQAVQQISNGIAPTLPSELLHRSASELEIGLVHAVTTDPPPDLVGETDPWIRTAFSRAMGRHRVVAKYDRRNERDTLALQDGAVQAEDGSDGWRPQARSLSLLPDDLAAPSRMTSVHLELSSSGRGLATVLAYLKLSETVRFQRVVERLREIVPIVRDIGFSRVEVSETVSRHLRVEDRLLELPETTTSIQDVLLFDFVDAGKVPASQVSEGTLLALGILTALETLDRGARIVKSGGVSTLRSPVDVILIDDIDRALHPRAQRALISMLRRILDATPDLQILATSHSPYLVDALRPEEVVILGRNRDGIILAKRLDSFPDERLRKMLSAGELWMSEGEEWVSR